MTDKERLEYQISRQNDELRWQTEAIDRQTAQMESLRKAQERNNANVPTYSSSGSSGSFFTTKEKMKIIGIILGALFLFGIADKLVFFIMALLHSLFG